MKYHLENNDLISTIQNNIPQGKNMVTVLMDILSIGKDSVYRRLRGEVPFTFEEVAKIAGKLDFSLDNLNGIKKGHSLFYLDSGTGPGVDLLENYYDALERHVSAFKRLNQDPNSMTRMALNSLPYMFYIYFEKLAAFKLYRWTYQILGTKAISSFSRFKVPQKILNIHKEFISEYHKTVKAHIILDKNAFSSFLEEIIYFEKLNMISQSEFQQLKEELLEMIDNLELLSKTQNKVMIFLSNINFEANYIHYEGGGIEFCLLRLYAIDSLISESPDICRLHKEWIESLKRYSTLITQSSQIERTLFFNKQRESLMNIH